MTQAGTSTRFLTNHSSTDVPVNSPPLPDGTVNLQETETRNTGFSSTDDVATRHKVPSSHDRGRLRAALSRSKQSTNSQHQDSRLRAQRRGRRGRPRGRPLRLSRGHTTISSRQTAPG